MNRKELQNPEWLDDTLDYLQINGYVNAYVSAVIFFNCYEIVCEHEYNGIFTTHEIYIFQDQKSWKNTDTMHKNYGYVCLDHLCSPLINTIVAYKIPNFLNTNITVW